MERARESGWKIDANIELSAICFQLFVRHVETAQKTRAAEKRNE